MAGQPGYYLFPNRTFIRKGANLTAAEADLIEAFAPVAVDEAGGFADFRETITKTNSLVDRLRALTLPAVADVRDGLESYRETVARAEHEWSANR